MKPLRCYFGKHEWERRRDGDRKYWACVHCNKEDPGPPEKYIPPAAPGAGSH